MPAGATIVLNSGGVRSLVASASTIGASGPVQVIFAFGRDGGPNTAARVEHVKRQALYLGVSTVLEMELGQARGKRSAGIEPAAAPALTHHRLLLAAAALALEYGATKIVWPLQRGHDFHAVARITEQIQIIQQLAQMDGIDLPTIHTPLLEMTDTQVVEIGAQMNVPWRLAWSCENKGERPCQLCPPCKRRKSAFEALGVVDNAETAEAV